MRNGSPINEVVLSKGRLEALSDGLFAIVMTLLVLELKIPELAKGFPDEELVHKLKELWPVLFSFVVTFILSGAFWLLHQLSFHFIRHTTRTLCWINLFFLMFVSVLPFSTGMMGRYLSRPVAMYVYYGNQTLIGLGLLAHWRFALSRGLVQADLDSRAVNQLTSRILMLPLAFGAALIMTAIRPALAMTGFAAVLAVFRIREMRRARMA